MRMMVRCTKCGYEQFIEVEMVQPDSMLTDEDATPYMSTFFECEECKHEMHVTTTIELFG